MRRTTCNILFFIRRTKELKGKGVALVFKLRYPLMFDVYKRYCDEKKIGIGKLWLYSQQQDVA